MYNNYNYYCRYYNCSNSVLQSCFVVNRLNVHAMVAVSVQVPLKCDYVNQLRTISVCFKFTNLDVCISNHLLIQHRMQTILHVRQYCFLNKVLITNI